MVHRNAEINDVIAPYFEPLDIRHFTISDENIVSMVSTMVHTFTRFRKWDKVASEFVNISLEDASKIKEKILAMTS